MHLEILSNQRKNRKSKTKNENFFYTKYIDEDLKMMRNLFKDYKNKGKIIVDLKLVTKEPLHIGGTEKSVKVNESDLIYIKRNNGDPFIPGSSFRGLLRAYVNRISHIFQDEDILKRLNIEDIRIDHRGAKTPSDSVCDLQEIFREELTPEQNMEGIAIEREKICDVCLLFGAKGYGSPLKVTDFNIEGSKVFIERNHIAIDLASDTTKDNSLFTVEAIAEGTVFKGKLILDKRGHVRQDRIMRLFELILFLLKNQEVNIGGLKSRGYGRIEVIEIKFREYSMEDEILGLEIEPIQIKIKAGEKNVNTRL